MLWSLKVDSSGRRTVYTVQLCETAVLYIYYIKVVWCVLCTLMLYNLSVYLDEYNLLSSKVLQSYSEHPVVWRFYCRSTRHRRRRMHRRLASGLEQAKFGVSRHMSHKINANTTQRIHTTTRQQPV